MIDDLAIFSISTCTHTFPHISDIFPSSSLDRSCSHSVIIKLSPLWPRILLLRTFDHCVFQQKSRIEDLSSQLKDLSQTSKKQIEEILLQLKEREKYAQLFKDAAGRSREQVFFSFVE
jgi:hypothetical protein